MESVVENLGMEEEKEALEYLDTVKTRAIQKGISYHTILRQGKEPYQLITDEAVEKNVDMIVIGRRGRGGLMKVLMGSVAAKVIGHAPCKVLVVPRAARVECRNILVAMDGSAHSIAAVAEAIGIANRCGSNILAVSTVHAEEEFEEAKTNVGSVVKMWQKEGIPVEALTPAGRSHDVIVETAGGRGVDLIVMGTYRENSN